ncbi:MAG: HU family DNA-binding protein, partial [Clostridia bacterium]|nr:HU family DNA-binding protein [Clostridia bacterium]
MNKSQLVESIAKKTEFTKKDSEKALAAVLETIEKALVKGDKVQLIGFGTFGTKKRAARTGRNPQTGATI